MGHVKSHVELCSITPKEEIILGRKDRTERLSTLQALSIKDIAPVLNTKDGFRSKTLTLKFLKIRLI